MKKLILFISAIFVFASLKAQTIVNLSGTKSKLVAKDTATFNMPFRTAGTVLTFQVNLTKVSGTDSGSVYVLGSLDNANFIQIGADSASFIGSKSVVFPLGTSNYPYYQVFVKTTNVNSDTTSVSAKAFYYK